MTINSIDVGYNKYNIQPYLSKRIGMYNKNTGERIGWINLNNELNNLNVDFDERLYRVGLMSDTHYNDGVSKDKYAPSKDDGSQYEGDLINAMQFYENKEDVEFVCVSGDISTDKIDHVKNFRKNIDKYCPNTPVYSCKGNHDNYATYNSNDEPCNNDIWKSCVSEYDDGKEKIYCDKGDGTSFYFIKTLASGKRDVYIFLNIDYGDYASRAKSNSSDSESSDEGRTHQYYHPEVLKWFAGVLEQFKHDRCFVFTHLFFRQKAGNYNGKKCYYKYYGWDRSRRYNLRGQQFLMLNELNNKYKNSIWFTGHTHYSWLWQTRDENISICAHDSNFIEGNKEDGYEGNGVRTGSIHIIDYKCDSAYNVHLPSLARPLALGEDRDIDYLGNEILVKDSSGEYYKVIDVGSSEGAIMDVYDDYVDIRGIIFKEYGANEYTNKYCPIATYRIPIGGKNIKQID